MGLITKAEKEIMRLAAENVALKRRLESEGHGKPCYYCHEKTNDLAARPSRWAIPLCHEDDPGVVKWHHIGCVSQRLQEREELLLKVQELEGKLSGINPV